MTKSKSCYFTVGIGLTDRCNSNCAHCYSRPSGGFTDLSFDSLKKLLTTMPIASVNFGTGESIFYPLFREAVEFIVTFGIPISLTTNGASVEKMEDGLLKLFHDIDFSIDFPFPGMNDNWRGAGNFSSVLNGIKRCQEANVECSIVVCLMKENSGYMGQISDLAQKLRVNLRINGCSERTPSFIRGILEGDKDTDIFRLPHILQ
jgi:MoaA/NifB/PqqE/SkfB family radical SAM enzyme